METDSLATIVLSNLGDVTNTLALPRREDGRALAGNMVLEGWSPMAPLRPGTFASFYTGLAKLDHDVRS